jgi:hypothetical protein
MYGASFVQRSLIAHARRQQRLLQGVLGVVHRAEHPVAVGEKLCAMFFDQAAEGILVAATSGVDELLFP